MVRREGSEVAMIYGSRLQLHASTSTRGEEETLCRAVEMWIWNCRWDAKVEPEFVNVSICACFFEGMVAI